MTHEAGLKAACNKAGSYGVHRPSDRCMADSIQAYLSASGMVLVPREPTLEMLMTQGKSNPTSDATEQRRKSIEILNRAVRQQAVATYREMIEAAPDLFNAAYTNQS